MKTLLKFGIMLGLLILVLQIRAGILSRYHWEKSYRQLWSLADKSSTIEAKRDLVNKFVAALEAGFTNGDFASHDAIWLRTPDNEFKSNVAALRTLASRLDEIKAMDPTSFQYNTAIQQITQQEQGEAWRLLNVLAGCYDLGSYPIVWSWVGGVLTMAALCMVFGCFFYYAYRFVD